MIPDQLKIEFDIIKKEIIQDRLNHQHVIVQKWKSLADGSPALLDIIFGTDVIEDEIIHKYPDWYYDSLGYYQNNIHHQDDMNLDDDQIFEKLLGLREVEGVKIKIVDSILYRD